MKMGKKEKKKKKRILSKLLVVMLALVLGAGIPAVKVHAANGAVYTCTVTPCYRHPVSGLIEDSGGEASYATGQGMAEGVLYTTGIMEVTENGEYYLTIRLSLMDYTSGHSFWVQNVGDAGWSSPALGVTGNGTDNNGTTADICMQVPSENCVVRMAMYVEPMGRDVIFYCYPSDYSAGNSTDMHSTMITASADSTASSADSTASSADSTASSADSTASSAGGTASSTGSETSSTGSTVSSTGSEASSTGSTASSTGSEASSTGSTASSTGDTTTTSAPGNTDEDGGLSQTVPPELESSIGEAASADLTADTEDTALNSAQGLSLSTAEDAASKEETQGTSDRSMGQQILILVISITIAGLILIGVAAGVVYYFRRNWYRWGGGEDDDE